jgi:hypothetical protein
MIPSFALFLILTVSCKSVRNNVIVINNLNDSLIFKIIDHKEPVIKRGDKGTEDNRFGFEGGTVLKINNIYQMFVAEMVDTPWTAKMRLAHWSSRDGSNWDRVSTLYESSGDYTGRDPRAALWSPMPFYNKEEGRWNMFYVSYKCMPNTDKILLVNHEGRVWRVVSETPGEKGYGGPYKDAGIVLEPGPYSDVWEGLQGCDSYYIYEANNRYYAFLGTAKNIKSQRNFLGVGLASAPKMAGPWVRCSDLNPVNGHERFIENPIVTNLDDGTYLAIFDYASCGDGGFGYMLSKDGVHWSKAHYVNYQPAIKKWWKITRTPLCLIKEEDGTFTTFYTAFTGSNYNDFDKNNGFACVGMVRFRISNPDQK